MRISVARIRTELSPQRGLYVQTERLLTSFSTEMSAQPRKTWVSFQTFELGEPRKPFTFLTPTDVMGIVHAGIHTLSSLGGVRVASITGDENPLVDGKLGRDSLTNCVRQLRGDLLQCGAKGDALI